MKKVKKILIIFLSVIFLITQNLSTAIAYEIPIAPSQPANNHDVPTPPKPPEAPSAPQTPNQSQSNNDKSSLSVDNNSNSTTHSENQHQENQQINNSQNNNQTEDTFIESGDANSAISSLTEVSYNSPSTSPNNVNSTNLSINNNGSSSESSSSSIINTNSQITQENNASIDNTLSHNTTTGQNNASYNVGNTTIVTGDANTTGIVVSSLNTNLEGISISEFQVADVHTGDFVLDFGTNCTLNCNENNTSGKNIGNNSDSTNKNIFQNNDANLENEITLTSNSGDNNTNFNTSSDSFIQTGDANVSANILSFLNNNLSGNIQIGIIDIFGALIGDIILPESEINSDTSTINQNIAGSNNTAAINSTINENISQTNEANIINDLTLNAETGGNSVNNNTGGDSIIQTGQAYVNTNTINIANSNAMDENLLIVIVNKAGEWIGKILGVPEGSLLWESNGSDSQNSSIVSEETNINLEQTNNAVIKNNVNLSANTGGNSASYNTSGNNVIKTGEAKIVANLINFVNNNVKGGKKLIVTVVNVFGKWVGNFVPPGTKKDSPHTPSNQNPTQLATAASSPKNNSQPQSISIPNKEAAQTKTTPIPPEANSENKVNKVISFQNNQIESGNQKVQAVFATASKNEPIVHSVLDKNQKKRFRINLAWLILLAPLSTIHFLRQKLIKRPLKFS